MKYRRFGDDILVRIDRGEEILSKLTYLVEQEKIHLGAVSGIGAVDHIKIGLYEVEKQEYHQDEFKGEEMEITSLVGNISTKNGAPYLHLHGTFAGKDKSVIGGHVNEAHISATSEIWIHVVEGEIDRVLDEEVTGLNLIQFNGEEEV